MTEPSITINGFPLTDGQATTIRCALQLLASRLGDEGPYMKMVYETHINAINRLISAEPVSAAGNA